MANVHKGVTEARKQEVLEVFRKNGTMSYSEVGRALNLTYYQARGYVGELVEAEQLKVVKTVGRTLYFNVIGNSRLPSMLGSSGFVNFTVVVRRSTETKLFNMDFTSMLSEAFAIFYSQPLLARVQTAISEDDMARGRALLSQARSDAERLLGIIDEAEAKLIPSDPPVGYYEWADDPQYDKELAVTARQKHGELPEYIVTAYRMLVGESTGITPLAPDTDSTDES